MEFAGQRVRGTIRWVLASPVTKNAGSLYATQAARYILPLIVVPYLVRVLGPANYGLVAFGQGLIAYLTVFLNYGFDWSASRKVAAYQSEAGKIGQIASAVWTAKLCLCVLCFVILFLLMLTNTRLHSAAALLFILSGILIGNMLFPIWLFSGMERMGAIAGINLLGRAVGTIAIFLFVRHRSDFLVYAAILSFQSVVSGLTGVGFARWKLQIKLRRPSLREVTRELKDGFVLFLSSSAISLYTAGNAFILGLFAGDMAVGYFAAAERIVKAIVSLFDPISQAVFPRFSKLAVTSRPKSMLWARRMLKLQGSLGLTCTLAILTFTEPICTLVLGPQYKASVPVMRILAALPLLIAISNVLGVQVMIPFHRDRAVFAFVAAAGVINIGLAALLAPVHGAVGMAEAILCSELIVTAGFLIYLSSVGLNPVRGNSRSDSGELARSIEAPES